MQVRESIVRFLAVDDERDIGELLVRMLAAHGFEGEVCASAHEALRLLEKRHFHLILSDLNMPGMDGMALLKRVRARHPEVAFVMITATDDVRRGVQAMKEGAADYLLKPFRAETVVSSLERAIEAKRKEAELQKQHRRLEELAASGAEEMNGAWERVHQTYEQTLEVLGRALDLRDNETAGHCQRVTSYSLELAKALKCTPSELQEIAYGAYLHDVGKIGIPDSILKKPGPLTSEEKSVMEAHARIGYELVSRISFLQGPAAIVLAHQERFDGKGYPAGLAGREIPLGARIFAVADTLDAMTSNRPYRDALPFSVARGEIIRESGRQFDPQVVHAFLTIPEQRWEQIRLNVFCRAFLPGALR